MKNHFYHIRCPPLNVTIFITQVRNCVMGATPMNMKKSQTSSLCNQQSRRSVWEYTQFDLSTLSTLLNHEFKATTYFVEKKTHTHKPRVYVRHTGPRSAVGNVSAYRCVSDCNSRGREFDPGPVPYFRGD